MVLYTTSASLTFLVTARQLQMNTKCEKFLRVVQKPTGRFGESIAAENFPSSWGRVNAAASRLKLLTDGSKAVLGGIELDSRTRGLLKDPWATGSYTPVTRTIYLAARDLTPSALDTVFHELAHAMLHHDISLQHYQENIWWIESEADVVCDLVRCMLGGSPRTATQRTLACLGNRADQAAFFHFASDTLCPVAEAIAAVFTASPPAAIQGSFNYACQTITPPTMNQPTLQQWMHSTI